MFFENFKDISKIAKRAECSIFAVPRDTKIELKPAIFLNPDASKKTEVISVEQVRDFCSLTSMKETQERFFVISPAEAMNEAAANAFLKTLEEPKPHCHFVLLAENPTLLLPTIRSRASIYYYRNRGKVELPPAADARIMQLAKQTITAKPPELIKIAEEISKDKKQPRKLAMEVTSTAIDILYKSYFKTGNVKFLTKLANYIRLYENLEQNGHVKLHLVADLL